MSLQGDSAASWILYLAFEEVNIKDPSNEEFGYWKVVERPLRLKVEVAKDKLTTFREVTKDAKDSVAYELMAGFCDATDQDVYLNYNQFEKCLKDYAKKMGEKLPAKRIKLIRNFFAVRDEKAEPVIKKVLKKEKEDSLKGRFKVGDDIVEYEPDTELRDPEQIPLTYEGGIQKFFEEEVLPYAPDAWINVNKTQIGYEISFTKYFYKPVQLRSLDEIVADIRALEAETEGLLQEIIGG